MEFEKIGSRKKNKEGLMCSRNLGVITAINLHCGQA